MNVSFNKSVKGTETPLSIDAMRGHAMKRLSGVHEKLKNKGLKPETMKKKDTLDLIGDEGFLNNLIIDSIMFFPISSFISANVPLMEAFNNSSTQAYAEGLSVMAEDAATPKGFKLNDYPEGRRRCALKEAKKSGEFNLLSAREKGRFSSDVDADISCMYEILDMLDKLEYDGVRAIKLDKKDVIYDTLRSVSKSKASNRRSFTIN